MRTLFDKMGNFFSFFNEENGFYMRTGIIDAAGKDTGVEVDRASYPQLIDVGIMGHCEHGLSGKCNEAGNHCYQSGGRISKANMSIDLFRKICEECKKKTFQFALGGRGDPNNHESFEEILKICEANQIVPNYTTSGYNITQRQIGLSVDFCGSVAISWYHAPYTMAIIDEFYRKGKPVNIHFVVSQQTIADAISILDNCDLTGKINAIVFLLYKPVGDATRKAILQIDNPLVVKFFDRVSSGSDGFRIGFDSCFVPAILKHQLSISEACLESCESGRFSCYIDAEGYISPCSFIQSIEFSRTMRNDTIQEIWDSQPFRAFVDNVNLTCKRCKKFSVCKGGCPGLLNSNLCGGTLI